MTQDIDLCLMCGFGNEEKYKENLIKQYKSRIDDPVTFALNNRVLLFAVYLVVMKIKEQHRKWKNAQTSNTVDIVF